MVVKESLVGSDLVQIPALMPVRADHDQVRPDFFDEVVARTVVDVGSFDTFQSRHNRATLSRRTKRSLPLVLLNEIVRVDAYVEVAKTGCPLEETEVSDVEQVESPQREYKSFHSCHLPDSNVKL